MKKIFIFAVGLFGLASAATAADKEAAVNLTCEVVTLNIGKHQFTVPKRDVSTKTNLKFLENHRKAAPVHYCYDKPIDIDHFITATSLRDGKDFLGFRNGVSYMPDHKREDSFVKWRSENKNVKLTDLPIENGFYKVSDRIFIATDKALVTPSGNPILLNCTRDALKKEPECQTGFKWHELYVGIGDTFGDFTFQDWKPAYLDTIKRLEDYQSQ